MTTTDWFEVRPATEGGLLACSWVARPSGEHRLTPDACLDLLWVERSAELLLCGPEHRSWTFSLPEGATAVGVRFLPGAAAALFGLDVAKIADRVVSLDEIAGDEANRRLVDRIAPIGDLDARRAALVTIVEEYADGVAVDPPAQAILDALVASPRASRAELAAVASMSERALHRYSCRQFGYGTATLARILRFQRFLAAAATGDRPRTISALAAEAGYADHAHVSRDCRAITSLTPSAFLAEYVPTFPDMADPYKTTEPLAVTLGR